MKCKFCGCKRFYAHQEVRMDIMVDSDNSFVQNCPEGAEASIYDSGTPYGPYICARCGAEYDELEEDTEPIEGPCEGWQKRAAVFTKEVDRIHKEANSRVQRWDGDSYSVLVVFYESGYTYVTVRRKSDAGKFTPEILVTEDNNTMSPASVTIETTSYGSLDEAEFDAYIEMLRKAQTMAGLINDLFVKPIREGTFDKEESLLFYD